MFDNIEQCLILSSIQSYHVFRVDVKQSQWSSPSDIKEMYRCASIIANQQLVFNFNGNRYRILVAVQYEFGIVYIRFIGTHSEYDKMDAATI